MGVALKKILVLLPVVVLGLFYVYDHASVYRHTSGHRLILLALSFGLLYGWMIVETLATRQRSFLRLSVQASFYVYVFMVLTLTGYFILFREVSVHDWSHRMMWRIDHRDHVNLHLFKIFRIYHFYNTQILGNLIMLLPLGIYLPLRYGIRNFFAVAFLCCLSSALIETLQLITSFRVADVDDVLLNTIGGCLGFWLLRTAQALRRAFLQKTPDAATARLA